MYLDPSKAATVGKGLSLNFGEKGLQPGPIIHRFLEMGIYRRTVRTPTDLLGRMHPGRSAAAVRSAASAGLGSGVVLGAGGRGRWAAWAVKEKMPKNIGKKTVWKKGGRQVIRRSPFRPLDVSSVAERVRISSGTPREIFFDLGLVEMVLVVRHLLLLAPRSLLDSKSPQPLSALGRCGLHLHRSAGRHGPVTDVTSGDGAVTVLKHWSPGQIPLHSLGERLELSSGET